MRILTPKDFNELYIKQWSNVLCKDRKELELEVLERGKVPFYCAAWSNIKSVRNVIKSGFRPAWAEMTVKTKKFVENMNRRNG